MYATIAMIEKQRYKFLYHFESSKALFRFLIFSMKIVSTLSPYGSTFFAPLLFILEIIHVLVENFLIQTLFISWLLFNLLKKQ